MNIQLPGFVVAELYKNNLVIISEKNDNPKTIQTSTKDKKINIEKTGDSLPDQKFWLGDNKKQVTIIVDDNDNVFLDDSELQFLTNILSACKMNLSDVAIVNIAHTTAITLNEFVKMLHSKYVLLLGVNQNKLSVKEKAILFAPVKKNNVQLMSAPQLATMMLQTPEAKSMKSQLWSGLKKMFGL